MAAYIRSSGGWKQQQQQQKQVQRENSIGPLRRAHPASGATWNVQIVRGKMSTRCLWHACRALMVGILLMIIGASMATIGYYSQDFTIGEFRHNSTIRMKNNDQRALHLNNLSYMGPIIMGVGGFVVVSSCVMTFEARDSAAKVVPARFKLSNNGRNRGNGQGGNSSRRTTTSVQSTESSHKTSGVQSGRWEQHLGLFKSSPGSDLPTDRHALTAALIHFSRTLGSPKCVVPVSSEFRMSKSGSVPNLNEKAHITHPLLKSTGSPNEIRIHRRHHHHHSGGAKLHRASKESTYLHPGLLRYHRHAISVDETSPLRRLNDSANGSQVSVTFDPTPEIIDIAPVHKKKPKCARSDTSRKHVLSRQMPIEKEDPNASPYHQKRRRSSTMSDNSCSSRKPIMAEAEISRRASSTSRTCSIDSRYMQNPSISSDLSRSPDRNRKVGSILSIDKENFRSQLSICSEPMVSIKQLSCQSSIEPCVVEEESANDTDEKHRPSVCYEETSERETKVDIEQSNNKNRPDSLILNTKSIEDQTTTTIADGKKFLYRSQSNRSLKKPKAKPSKILSSDLDQIYVISSNTCERSELNDFYDSIEVISERRSRSKNFMEFNKCNDESENSCRNNPSKSNEIVVEIESRENE
ncbi:hypothetical protein PVAND_008624 [Polypedilum vanderplanki]|uniref:Transmembrane protein n=1 Tax=Polypedilum vanderplanki TaxID=319348 RepID=A0A9J6CAT9_POLVA|nr:hypothetical protein PVAND_008624 [Polypedilum vanderplanki]